MGLCRLVVYGSPRVRLVKNMDAPFHGANQLKPETSAWICPTRSSTHVYQQLKPNGSDLIAVGIILIGHPVFGQRPGAPGIDAANSGLVQIYA